jgi:hypothetical protein
MSVEKYFLSDGRRAECHSEVVSDGCDHEVVKEFFEEERIPMRMSKRVLETTRPMVVERVVESIGEDGDVVERKRESLLPDRMETREHIALTEPRMAMKKKSNDCDCMTREEVMELMASKNAMEDVDGAISDGQVLVEQKQKDEVEVSVWDVVGVGIIVAQLAAIGWFLIML